GTAPAGGRRGSARSDRLGPLLGGVAELVGVLPAGLLRRLLGALRGLLGDVLAALHGLLPRVLDLILDLVGQRADLLVLDAGGRDEQARDEPDGDAADGEAERVLLRDARRALDLLTVRRDVRGLAGQL